MRYRFGAFELDVLRYELRRDGQAVRVEPRVLDLLFYLVRNRERIVTKEELIDGVWKGQFVGESALSRCIMEARKAIAPEDGDDDPIKTVHRRGYRFIAPTTEQTLNEIAVPIVAEPIVKLSPTPPSRMPLFAIASALVVLTIVVAALRFPFAPKTPIAAAKVIRLAVLPVSPEEDDAESLLLATMVSDLLSTRLAAIPNVVVRHSDVSADLSASALTLAELADRAAVTYIVSGSLRRVEGADKGRVDLTLHHFTGKGRVETTPLGRYDIPFIRSRADVQHFHKIRESITRHVVDRIGPVVDLRLSSGNSPQDPQAYRLYLLGRDRLVQSRCDVGALELLERSLELDPTFASAWEVFALAHYGQASSCGGDAAQYKNAIEGLDRALKLEPGRQSAIALNAIVLAESGHVEDAYESLRNNRRSDVMSPDAEFAESYVLCYAGHLSEAQKRLDAAVSADPNYLAMSGWTPNVYLYRNDPERFLRFLPATESAPFRYYRSYAHLLLGHSDVARNTLAPAFRLSPHELFARMSASLLEAIEGRPSEAREILRGLERQRSAVGSTDGALTYQIAQLFERAGDSDTALRGLNRAVDQGFFCAPCLASDASWNRIRQRPEFVAALNRAETRRAAFAKRFALVN